jgi:hypothetical protein
MAPELHGACFLKHTNVKFENFKKFRKNNLDIDNYEIYFCVKINLKLIIFSLSKYDKSAKFSNLETMHSSLDSDPCIIIFAKSKIQKNKIELSFRTLVDPISVNI